MSDRDERIREIAYFLWLEDGRPEGEAERHWLAAEGVVEPETAEGVVEPETAEGETSGEPKKKSPITETAR